MVQEGVYMESLVEKVVLITGGTRGIGRALAERCVELGAAVVICCRHESHVIETIEALATQGGGLVGGMQCDIARYEEVRALFAYAVEKFGGVDILVNNAGLPQHGPLHEMTPFPDEWDYVLATNLMGAVYCSHEAIPLMMQKGGGWIVNVSSLAAEETEGGNAAYATSKAALNAFSESVMNEVRQQGIHVGVISPGLVNTEFGGKRLGHPERALQPEDIVEAIIAMVTAPERSLTSMVEIRPRWVKG